MKPFGWIYGGKPEKYTEAERNFLFGLVKLRLFAIISAADFPKDSIEWIVEDIVRTQNLSGDNLFFSPDIIIFKIVRDFIRTLADNLKAARLKGIEVDIDAEQKLIIEKIEKDRNNLFGMDDADEFPRTLDDYVFYRVQREVPFVGGIDNPAGIGFTRETVQAMTDLVKEGCKSNFAIKI